MAQETHILLLDDEKNYLLVLETLLIDQGYTVTALSDPETALTVLEQSEVDVVISDLKMPKLTGRDVLQFVKKKFPHIPFLIMTSMIFCKFFKMFIKQSDDLFLRQIDIIERAVNVILIIYQIFIINKIFLILNGISQLKHILCFNKIVKLLQRKK